MVGADRDLGALSWTASGQIDVQTPATQTGQQTDKDMRIVIHFPRQCRKK